LRLDLHELITSDVILFSTWRLHGNRIFKTRFITYFIITIIHTQIRRRRNNKNAERKRERRRRNGDASSTVDPSRPTSRCPGSHDPGRAASYL